MTVIPAMLAASAAAAAAQAERRHVDALRTAGATAPERARPIEPLGLERDAAFERLAARGILREASGGVYLDEVAFIAHRDRPAPSQRGLLIGLVLLLVVMMVGLALLVRSRDRARGDVGSAGVHGGDAAVTAPGAR